MKILVVVESPGKTSKMKEVLDSLKDGNNYVVTASAGHILDLNKVKTLGVDLNDNYRPDYVEYDTKSNIISQIRKLYRSCDKIWLATDLDLEGEFIGYSICHVLGIDHRNVPRLIFNEISPTAILNAAANPTHLDQNILDAQKCRRIMDRLIGFRISAAASTVNDKLTIGRVQTIFIKLVLDREREMEQFQKAFSFYTTGQFAKAIDSKLNKTFKDVTEMKQFLEDCAKKDTKFLVANKAERMNKKNPPPPLTTTTLQSLISSRLSISPKKVMEIAQNLYQKGVISYPRTDCPRLPEDKMKQCEDLIKDKFGEKFHESRVYETKDEDAQEAHACIYPIKLENRELSEENFNSYDRQVYRFIWLYAVSSQMTASETKITKVEVGIQMGDTNSDKRKERFVAEHSQLIFEGYEKVWGKTAAFEKDVDDNSDDDSDSSNLGRNYEVLDLCEGDFISCRLIDTQQKASKGPAPYTESNIISKMKQLGVGRPSCLSSILANVIQKDFIYKASKSGEKVQVITMNLNFNNGESKLVEGHKEISLGNYRNRLYSTELGKAIDDFVNKFFPEVFNYNFTSSLQSEMKKIENGGKRWVDVVDRLYKTFEPKLKQFPRYRTKNDGANPAWKPKRQLEGKKDGKNVYTYLAKYGPVIQIGDDEDNDKKFVPLPKDYDIEKVKFSEVKALLGFPYNLGKLNDGREVVLKKSKYGLYMNLGGKKNYNVSEDLFDDLDKSKPTEQQIDKLNLEKVVKAIADADKPKNVLRTVENLEIVNGKYGPYFIYMNTIVGIPKCRDYMKINHQDLMELYRNKICRKGGKKKKMEFTFKKKV